MGFDGAEGERVAFQHSGRVPRVPSEQACEGAFLWGTHRGGLSLVLQGLCFLTVIKYMQHKICHFSHFIVYNTVA